MIVYLAIREVNYKIDYGVDADVECLGVFLAEEDAKNAFSAPITRDALYADENEAYVDTRVVPMRIGENETVYLGGALYVE